MALWSVASLPAPQKSILSEKCVTRPLLLPLSKPAPPIQPLKQRNVVLCCSSPKPTPSSSSSSFYPAINTGAPPVLKKRTRYRKLSPGESKGITEEMRFVAMRLRNIKGRYINKSGIDDSSDEESEKGDSESEKGDSESENGDSEEDEEEGGGRESDVSSDGDGGDMENGGENWTPSTAGFVKYLVDSKLVFDTVERIVDESSDVAYVYFRKTGLERSQRLSRDLEWFRERGVAIPEPSKPGVTYSAYLEKLAVKSAPLFLCHFYSIYFSHIAGGQVIGKKVSEKILDGRELEFYQWDGDESMLLKRVRENLNNLGEHWKRSVKNRCLSETRKSFRYLGEIVRLIISTYSVVA